MTTHQDSRVAVQLDGVSQVFNAGRDNQVVALDAIDLTIRTGEFVSLIGPSGCGKSTLLRAVADLVTPTAGTVTINGKSAAQARQDTDYGMAFQQAGLFDWRSVAENVTLPMELRKVPARRAGAAPRSCWRWCTSAISATTDRGSCPAGCSSAWRSRGRWR